MDLSQMPSWLVPLIANVSVALTMLKVLSSQLEGIKTELKELSKDFRNTREEVAALQKSDGFQSAQIEKLEERINKVSEYWQRRTGQ
jgi:chromosome segregation ATPase